MNDDGQKQPKWVKRWKQDIAAKPVKPGVWRRKEGGYLARGRAQDPRTGKLREVRMVLPEASAQEAYDKLQAALRAIRDELADKVQAKTLFRDYSVSLLERKVRANEIRSQATVDKWRWILRLRLIPAFGDVYMDKIRRADIIEWKDQIAKDGAHPRTANDWLGTLRVILRTWADDNELPRSPIDGVKPFDLSLCPTYTEEEPNSLTPEETESFLREMHQRFPQHFAMVALGFATGLRPSSLRPLRKSGASPDILWDKGELLVRRSHSRGKVIVERTKTGRNQKIQLGPGMLDILKWHVATLPAGVMADSELLFPATDGGLRSYEESGLVYPFKVVAKAIGLTKHISPKCMRRTVQDAGRLAEVPGLTLRSITGHATETMQNHYSTVRGEEQAQAMGKVIDILGILRARGGASGGAPSSSEHQGENGSDEKAKKTG